MLLIRNECDFRKGIEIQRPITMTVESLNCRRASSNPSWYTQLLGWQSIRFHEQGLVEGKAYFPVFLDPISCEVSYASFVGSTNVREQGHSNTSGASNRLRQVALGVSDAASVITRSPRNSGCLSDFNASHLHVFNTDSKILPFIMHLRNYIYRNTFLQIIFQESLTLGLM